MRLRSFALVLAGSAALAGCATIVPDGSRSRGSELIGHTLRVGTAKGQVSTLTFEPDNRVVAAFGERQVPGLWRAEEDRLCFTWGGNFEECWPYTRPFRRGKTVSVTSSRGNVVDVTLVR